MNQNRNIYAERIEKIKGAQTKSQSDSRLCALRLDPIVPNRINILQADDEKELGKKIVADRWLDGATGYNSKP